MAEISQRLPFSQLEINNSRKGPFGTSFVVQAIGVAILLNLSFAAPKMLEKKRYESIELTAPVEQAKVSPAPKVKVAQPKIKVEPTPVPQPQQVKITPPKMPTRIPKTQPVMEAKIEAPAAPKFDAPRVDLPPGPKPPKPIHTNNFGSTGSSATPTLANKNANEVQTGGFGDPNGVPASGNHTGKVAIAKLGSFDLPEGSGQGNGTGGGHGAKGTVASAGFGNGTAIQGGGGRGTGGNGKVVQTAFGAPQPADATPTKKAVAADSGFTPFTILSKPKPAYTEEGRKRHIEGEVQLDVVFMANGQIKVLGVTRGLGYGLDEAAIRAAQQIQFVPAKRGGQPVDYQAKLRILFQLT